MNSIGIMQGRLLPPLNNKIQAYPGVDWKKEFYLSKELGLDCIEWIVERFEENNNPVITKKFNEIKNVMNETGVRIAAICADTMMDEPLIGPNAVSEDLWSTRLESYILAAAELNVPFIDVPFVDASSMKTKADLDKVHAIISNHLALATSKKISLCLETDLTPEVFSTLLKRFDHPYVGANYDTGNSAALNYHPNDELPLIGPWLKTVHLKDRVLGATTVVPGTGNASFDACFDQFKKLNYKGHFIFQTARNGNEVENIRSNLQFFKPYFEMLNHGS